MIIQPLTSIAEFRRCVELQKQVFGWQDIDILPVRALVVVSRIGGIVLGAFEADRIVAFVNAMPGFRDNRPYWHSHMLAVSQEYWNTGLGFQLKRAQREFALERGIRLIEWTFDPLESKNAHLNINKLGVIVRRYSANHFGETSGALQIGLESDRLVAEWWLERTPSAIGEDVRRVRIPADLQALKKRDLPAARDVQLRVREQFLRNFADGYFVAGFERGVADSHYLFVPGADHAS